MHSSDWLENEVKPLTADERKPMSKDDLIRLAIRELVGGSKSDAVKILRTALKVDFTGKLRS